MLGLAGCGRAGQGFGLSWSLGLSVQHPGLGLRTWTQPWTRTRSDLTLQGPRGAWELRDTKQTQPQKQRWSMCPGRDVFALQTLLFKVYGVRFSSWGTLVYLLRRVKSQ